MVYEILGHVFQLVGIFFAFLAVGMSFFYAQLIKGGVAGRAAFYNALGFTILAINIFLIYGSAITGRLNLLNITFLWPLLGFLTLLGFSLISYAQYALWRITKE